VGRGRVKFRVEVTRTYTGVIDADQLVASWPDEFDEFCRSVKTRGLSGDTLVEAFVRHSEKEVGGMEMLDDFAESYDTDEDTSLVKL